jgi:sulfatase modifying factor 1
MGVSFMAIKLWILFPITVGLLNFGCVGKPQLFIDLTTAVDKVSVMPALPGTALTSTTMEMVYVRGGCYQMGDIFDDPEGGSEEKPVHEVCVDSFYLGKYEVTQGQWKSVMGSNPSSDKSCGVNCPVDNVSWSDVQDFVLRLNSSSGGRAYRLPTEAEWEYAARSGGKSEKYPGSNDDVDNVAWHNDNAGEISQPVGTRDPNGLGIYDMGGSVWEWTNDWYDSDYYSRSPRNNPSGPSSGIDRAVRGGCRTGEEYNMRTARRNGYTPDTRRPSLGFRLLKTP